jgi:ribA/ribD-fused uncharacterized protein
MSYTKYTFFYKMRHPFSNWYRCKFKDSEEIEYNCSEQYMMAEKAKLFGDEETREKILASKDPKEQKELGRLVKNFDSMKWESECKEIVYRGCYLKFTQDQHLLKTLLATNGTLLVEASPYDKIWGIGMGEDDPNIHDRKKWKGKNWLGEVLTQLRDDIFNK